MKFAGILNKRFPTIIGLFILFAALGAGVFFIGVGPGIFTPRAAPQTTPKNVKITNITESTLTVSFLTDEPTTSFVKYGTSATSLNNREADDRDQLSGNVGTYNTHHITIRNLQADTTYFFTLGTGSNSLFDNSGKPYTIKTGPKVGSQSTAQTIYGTVLTKDSNPAEGSVVYVTVDKGGELSTLVRSSGTWAIPLSQLRSPNGGNAPEFSSNTLMQVFVQGKSVADTAVLTTTVGQPQFPVKTITLGETNTPDPTQAQTNPTVTLSQSGTDAQPTITASGSATIKPTVPVSPTIALSPTAGAAATITAIPSVTKIPTNTPKLTATATLSEDSSLPATNSPKPVSGSTQDTLVILIAGLLFMTFGGAFYLSVRK